MTDKEALKRIQAVNRKVADIRKNIDIAFINLTRLETIIDDLKDDLEHDIKTIP